MFLLKGYARALLSIDVDGVCTPFVNTTTNARVHVNIEMQGLKTCIQLLPPISAVLLAHVWNQQRSPWPADLVWLRLALLEPHSVLEPQPVLGPPRERKCCSGHGDREVWQAERHTRLQCYCRPYIERYTQHTVAGKWRQCGTLEH